MGARQARSIALTSITLAALLVGAVGCDQIFDIDEGQLAGDGGPHDAAPLDGTVADGAPISDTGASDAGVEGGDADADTTIHGTWIHHHVTDNGVAEGYIDFTQTPVSACVPNPAADGGADCYRGIGTALGTFTIEGVPLGVEYYVHADIPPDPATAQGPLWAYSHDRTIDLSDYQLGRIDVALLDSGAASTTVFALDVTGADPWQNGDTLDLVSSNSGVTVAGIELLQGASNTPTPGEAHLTVSAPWASTAFANNASAKLIDSSRQDQTNLLQLSVQDAGMPGGSYQVLSRALTSTTFSNVPRATSTLSGAMQAPTSTVSVDVVWHHDDFRAHVSELNPTVGAIYEVLFLDVVRGDGTYGTFFATLDLVVYTLPNGGTGNESLTLSAPNPFPNSTSISSGWTPFVSPVLAYTVSQSIPLPDGGVQSFQSTGIMACSATSSTLTTTPDLTPLAGAVANSEIASKDFLRDQTGVGETPTISWQPASYGNTPSLYTLWIREVVPGQPGTSAVAALTTDATQILLPPGILHTGHFYVMSIEAVWTPGPILTRSPLLRPFGCSAQSISGVFTP